MGVTGLWTVLHPCARPIKLETLNKKRLAVDASIWIYQFLKAVRDKEGNQLRNSHIVGFFRRICKLLFVGIKPVFVFDGGAPALKRQTITSRKRRREGRREDAARTAGKLLAMQMQRLAEEEDAKRREDADDTPRAQEPLPDQVVYVDELTMTPAERQKNRKFRKRDAYDLPELETSMAEMGQPNDPRVMSLEELQQYAHQFNTGEDINVYDFSKIDFDSMFFQGLPPSDQYNILNAARLRSRLRMGYSKQQLDGMFPDRMAFSRFQVERAAERNSLTQRLMRLQGMSIDGTLSGDGATRIAGEKGREYVLVRNDGVEGGWALGVVNTQGQQDRPIDVDEVDKPEESVSEEDSEEFEDVPIVTLDMLPRLTPKDAAKAQKVSKSFASRRKRFYSSRRGATQKKRKVTTDRETLFVQQSDDEGNDSDDTDGGDEHDDAELQQAIAMSLQQDHSDTVPERHEPVRPLDGDVDSVDEPMEEETPLFAPQRRVDEPAPFFKGRGMTIAHAANARAMKAATRPTSKPFLDDSDSDDDIDFRKAVTQTKKSQPDKAAIPQVNAVANSGSTDFSGPLPFEKLDLGASMFQKKKFEKVEEPVAPLDPDAGGFVVEDLETQSKKAKPLPPWFSKQAATEEVDEDAAIDTKPIDDGLSFTFETNPDSSKSLPEVIDLEADQSSENESDAIPQIIEADSMIQDQIDSVPHITSVVDADPDNMARPVSPEPSLNDAVRPPSTTPPMPPSPSDDSQRHVMLPPEATALDVEDEDMDWEEVEVAQKATNATEKQSVLSSEETKQTDSHANGNNSSKTVPTLNHEQSSVTVKGEEGEEFDYSDPEEEELFRQLAQEQDEHLRFASTLNNRSLASNMADFEAELKKLRVQQKKDLRDADEVTQTMITECQQLLALFGLPYITAPMEAEAQCAELVRLGLVDGVVTDDSDVFLFGGTRIYKNMFNQAKLVECYLTRDLESEFGLTRHRLIAISQLLGSDYTEGLPGIGPVTALEIISEFQNLENFRDWWAAAQSGRITKAEDAMNAFKKKFRRHLTKLFLPSLFPDPRVEDAYMNPTVDSDPSDFVWGVPDLSALRAFLSSTIGWSPERTDEILVPVIRDMNKRDSEGTQANITAFFGGTTGAGAFAPRRRDGGSNRLQSALQRMGSREVAHIDTAAGREADSGTNTQSAKRRRTRG